MQTGFDSMQMGSANTYNLAMHVDYSIIVQYNIL